MKPPDSTRPFTFYTTEELKQRTRAVMKKYKMSISSLCREALRARVEFYEEKERLENERKKREAEERRGRPRRIGDSPLAPIARSIAPKPTAVEQPKNGDRDDDDEDDALYAKHAQHILEAVNDAVECRIRTREAVDAIMRQAPLTNPGELAILRRLETIIVDARAEKRMAKVVDPIMTKFTRAIDEQLENFAEKDDMIGRTIDPSKTKIVGNIEPNEEE